MVLAKIYDCERYIFAPALRYDALKELLAQLADVSADAFKAKLAVNAYDAEILDDAHEEEGTDVGIAGCGDQDALKAYDELVTVPNILLAVI